MSARSTPSTRSLRRPAARTIAVFLVVAAASACSDSSANSDDAAGTTVDEVPDDATETTGTPSSTTVASSPPVTEPANTSAANTSAANTSDSTTVPPFTGDSDSEWCRVSAELIALSDAFEAAPVTDANELEQTFVAFVDRMALIAFVAPPEIVDDVVTTVDVFAQLRELLAAADFDMAAVDVSSIQAQRAEIASASARIARYNREVCQLDPDTASATSTPGDATDPTTSAPDAVREAAIAILIDGGYSMTEAVCIADGIQAGTSTDALLIDCGVSFDANDG